MKTKWLPLLCVLCLCAISSSVRAGDSGQTQGCSLIPSFENSKAHYVKKGPYRKAFRQVGKARWKSAHKAFERAFNRQRSDVITLFQSPNDTEISNEEIQRFLEKYVLGPHPVLLVNEDNFILRPEVALTWVRTQCQLGINASQWEGLEGLSPRDHPSVLEAQAMEMMMRGDHGAAMVLVKEALAHPRPPIRVMTVASLNFALMGDKGQAYALSQRVNELCLGPVQCAWASWLRRELEEVHNGTTP
jgi:hypothetical protein